MEDIHDIRPPVQVGMDPFLIRVALIVFAAVALAAVAFLIYGYLKRRKARKSANLLLLPLPLSLDEAAFKALDSIMDLMTSNPRLFYFRLTEILKRFIGKQFEFGAPEMTTQELVASIRSLGFDRQDLADIRDFLLFSDTIKYAGKAPLSEIMQGHGVFVRQFITSAAAAASATDNDEKPGELEDV